MLHPRIQRTLAEAVNIALTNSHQFVSLEHVLLALTHNHPAQDILESCGVNIELLRKDIKDFLDKNCASKPKASSKRAVAPPQTTLALQRTLQQAVMQVQSCGKKEVEESHLLVAFFSEPESYAVYFLKKQGVTRYSLVKSSSVVTRKASSYLETKEELSENFSVETEVYREEPIQKPLEVFCENLNEKVLAHKHTPLIGRQKELERAVHVMTRKNKNNPLFVGEPGVGKTALAYGLAERIVQKKVPNNLKNATVYSLDLGNLLAGTKYRGDFEARFKAVVEALRKEQKPILFIDEIQTIMGAGSTSGSSLDVAGLLKPLLTEGDILCMGATTYKDYRQNIQKDRTLSRRFQEVEVREPDPKETLEILKGLQKQYEEYHKVKYSSKVLKAIIALCDKYMSSQFFPDKSIDVLDEVGAKVHLQKKEKVDVQDVEKVVSLMTRTPVETVSVDEIQKLETLEDVLQSVIFGQKEAVEKVVMSIKLSRSGLQTSHQPMGSYLFIGPTGVGKTELSKQLAKALGVDFVRFDMSEYMERHSVARLIGSPPGYVGYEEGGLLVEEVFKKPHCVLLLDEIEKAHPDVLNLLLQAMDRGEITDSNGKVASFKNLILIMTSNAGAFETSRGLLGLHGEKKVSSLSLQAVKKQFSPEFLNRLSAVVTFQPLSQKILLSVIEKFLKELKGQLKAKSIDISWDRATKEWIYEKGYDPAYGARPFSRTIDEHIKKPLVDQVLFGSVKKGGKIGLSVKKGHLDFLFDER